MKTALEIIQFISYSSNTEVSKVSSWSSVKQEALNGLNRAIRVLWNSKEWNFRREIKKTVLISGKNSLSMSNYILAQDGIRINNNPLEYDSDIPFYEETTGVPEKYYLTNKDKIIFYPIPDKKYNLSLEYYNINPIIDKNNSFKQAITQQTDTLNITERLENLFIDCLNYFCNEILNGDVTDEEYQEHTLRYSEVYKLLEKADMATLDNNNDKRFLMPWQ